MASATLLREEFDKLKAKILDDFAKKERQTVWKGSDPKVALSIMLGLEKIHGREEAVLSVESRLSFGESLQYVIRYNSVPLLWEIASLEYKEGESMWRVQNLAERMKEFDKHLAMLATHAIACEVAAENMIKQPEVAAAPQ